MKNKRKISNLSSWISNYQFGRETSVVLAVIIVVILFSIASPYFFSPRNILGNLRAMSSLAIMSFGLLLVIVCGEIDLSVGAVYGLAAMIVGILWIKGVSLYLALAIGLASGAFSGLIAAFFVNYVMVPSFVVTLGLMSVARGVTLLVSGSKSISPEYMLGPGRESEVMFFKNIAGFHVPFDIPAQIIWMFGIALIIGLLLNHFIFGFRLKAIGGNEEAAKVMKLPVKTYKFIAFAVSGLLCALAGILDFSFLGNTDPMSGTTLTFPVFAAVIIGGASLSGGKGSVIGTIFAAGLLTVLTNGMSMLGIGGYAQSIFVGLVTIGAVSIDRMGSIIQLKNLKDRSNNNSV